LAELADGFRRHGPEYRAKHGHKMPPSHHQAMRAIERCRTEALGGHVCYCHECEETQYQYHSCRNRHCPKCQNDKAQQWLEKQQGLLLPVAYFLLTFTLPAGLRQVVRSDQVLIYNLLYRTSAAARQLSGRDPRFDGGQIGMIGALHTWGRNLAHHPHAHYLVPAGGVAADEHAWIAARNKFLFPVKALSKISRAKFRDALQKTTCYGQVPAAVWKQDWVVHYQPAGSGQTALKYLAPYIFRVAISNKRILKLEDGKVTFRYRASDTGKSKVCTLSAQEFIRRVLQHVLPRGFVKVRYYGYLSPGRRPTLASLRQQLEGAGTGQSTSLGGGDKETQTAGQPPQHLMARSAAPLAVRSCSYAKSSSSRNVSHPEQRGREHNGFPSWGTAAGCLQPFRLWF
jgi:hypothetical protein